MEQIRFLAPIDGDCMNTRDGAVRDGVLYVRVTAEAPDAESLTLNGVSAERDGSRFTAEVPLDGWRNKVIAAAPDGRKSMMTLFRLKDPEMKFRLSSDDNILFLADLNANKDVYTSIFDNPYLAVYKKAHDLYGVKVHLNLFYAYDEKAAKFSCKRDYFDLSMMTDRYRDEFTANSDWLRLAFHAASEFPDKPYKDAGFDQVLRDAKAVNREIIRFAGPACLGDTTTVHWGELNREGCRAMRALGYRSLTGYFEMKDGEPLVAYYADEDLISHVGARDFWYDSAEDMFFGRIDLVLNIHPVETNLKKLREITADPYRGGFVSIMIHEQYFYEDYIGHLPDFEQRVLTACEYLSGCGYKGAHITETVAEPRVRSYPN